MDNLKVKSLGKAMEILNSFTLEKPVRGVTDIALDLSLPKSSVFNILQTFTQLGYIEKTDDDRYCLGLKLFEFSFAINHRLGYPGAVYDLLMDSAELSNHVTYFALPNDKNLMYLYVAHPVNRLKELPYRLILGETAPYYCTGLGKAILAHLPETSWRSSLPKKFNKFQPNTLTDLDSVIEELHAVKARGYAIDNCEHEKNVRCVGVPVFSYSGKLVAGISVSSLAETMTNHEIRRCAKILQTTANKMSERIYL